jgi:hypothetical protein
MSLTVHFQSKNYADEFVARCNGRLTHIVGVDMYLPYPGVETFYRTYLPDAEAHALVDRGKDGASAWIDKFANIYRQFPNAIFISSNEYLLYDSYRVDRFNAFHVEYIQRMSQLGHRVACGQINTGWMRLRKYGNPPPYPESIAPVLAALWAHEGILTLHEYWPGAVTPDGNILTDPTGNIYRYRDFRAALLAAGITNLPPFFVSELGIDVQSKVEPNDFGHKGWREFVSWPVYLSMLKGYSTEMNKDPYMLGASVFTEGGGWETFELGRDNALQLADYIGSSAPPPPPPPERAKGLYLSKYQEGTSRVVLQRLWDDGYRAIGFRVTGPNDPENPTYTEVDKVFTKFYPIAKEIGFLCYGFHYLHPALNNQARDFGRAVVGKEFKLGLYGDVEHKGLDANRCARFFKAADRETGQTVDVYGRTTQLNSWRVSSDEGLWQEGRRLWLAAWTYDLSKTPTLPETWKNKGTEWWQWTNMAYLPGVEPPDRVCLDAWRGTTKELLDEYAPNGGNGDDMVEVVDRYGKPLGMTWEEVQAQFGLRMVAATPPEGATVWRLSKIIHDSTTETNLRLYCRDENGAPLSKITVFMGMHPDIANPLPANMAPRFSLGQQGHPIDPLTNQPYPNIAWLDSDNSQNWTNADGYVQRSLGSGSNTSPPRPIYQWAWVGNGEEVVYTDWVYGIGGMWVDDKGEHQMWWPEFKRVTEGDEPPPPPPPPGSYQITGFIGGIPVDLVVKTVE